MGPKRLQPIRYKRTPSSDVTRRRRTSRSPSLPRSTSSFLRLMRERINTVRATVYLCTATLRAQQSDADTDVALVLQRSAGDALDREVEALDVILAEGARNRRLVTRKSPVAVYRSGLVPGSNGTAFIERTHRSPRCGDPRAIWRSNSGQIRRRRRVCNERCLLPGGVVEGRTTGLMDPFAAHRTGWHRRDEQ